MSVNPILPEGADTTRLPSTSIWGRCPWASIVAGMTSGVAFYDDFLSFPITPATTEGNWSQYAQFSSTGGTITAGTGQGGEAIFASDDDNEGAAIRTLSTPYLLNSSVGRFWFECRVKTSTIANTTLEWFIGLMENTALTSAVPITTTAATLADKNLCGFYRTESAGSTVDTTYKADGVTAVTVGSAEVTLVASTYVKLGMKYEPSGDKAGAYRLSFYKDGTRLTTSKQLPASSGTDFPADTALGLVLATRNAAGSSPGTLTVDWWRAAQEI